MRRKPPSARDEQRAYAGAENMMALAHGKPLSTRVIPAEHKPRAPAKPRTEPSESEILKAVMHLLKRHPKVAVCWRQNSGTAQFAGADGKTRYVRANTARGMSDIMGTLKDGRTLACEVKTRTGRIMPHQQEFLDGINKAGGVAFVARSLEDVMEALNAA